MGMIRKRVKVCNSKDPARCFEEQFWVDTGALYSFVPEDFLERIGIEPSATRTLVLADGRRETRLLGFCDLQVEGLEGSIPCPVIFAPKGSLFLLGTTSLENFGVEVDPINNRLKPRSWASSADSSDRRRMQARKTGPPDPRGWTVRNAGTYLFAVSVWGQFAWPYSSWFAEGEPLECGGLTPPFKAACGTPRAAVIHVAQPPPAVDVGPKFTQARAPVPHRPPRPATRRSQATALQNSPARGELDSDEGQ